MHPAGTIRTQSASGMRWRIVGAILLSALVPLGLTGAGAWAVLGGMLEERSLDLQRSLVLGHARHIDMYLAERARALSLVARTQDLTTLTSPGVLADLLADLNASFDHAFIDLGVIDETGAHRAYEGPYQLNDKNYADQPWFRRALERETYVSDVFTGYRRVPHCILTVRQSEAGQTWLLRATIDSAAFAALVQADLPGRTGEAFLLDTQGRYQTASRAGPILAASGIPTDRHTGVREQRISEAQRALLRTTTWLEGVDWMLVIQQDEAEVRAPVRAAMWAGAAMAIIALLLLAAATLVSTLHLTNQIERAVSQRDALSKDLLRSAKLASLGELSTGLAHEINNPLAIISAEQTNIGDQIQELEPPPASRAEMLASVDCIARQVKRCGAITAKMLQFGRDSDTRLAPIEVGPRLEEIVDLLERQALVRNVDLTLEVEPDLPALVLDANELQQVILNLINNSLYAVDGAGGRIAVTARRSGDEVLLTVADTGPGIRPEDLEHVFQPFFTTKPPGQGTGLGLSVCYGIVIGWGGRIEAESAPGQGTRMIIHLPVP